MANECFQFRHFNHCYPIVFPSPCVFVIPFSVSEMEEDESTKVTHYLNGDGMLMMKYVEYVGWLLIVVVTTANSPVQVCNLMMVEKSLITILSALCQIWTKQSLAVPRLSSKQKPLQLRVFEHQHHVTIQGMTHQQER